MAECKHCVAKGEEHCAAEIRGPRRWVCTRPAGHEGDHIACGVLTHDIHRWENKDVQG